MIEDLALFVCLLVYTNGSNKQAKLLNTMADLSDDIVIVSRFHRCILIPFHDLQKKGAQCCTVFAKYRFSCFLLGLDEDTNLKSSLIEISKISSLKIISKASLVYLAIS